MKDEKKMVWMIDFSKFSVKEIEIAEKLAYELARNRGKGVGDSVNTEFIEILMKIDKESIKFLGTTDKDIDMLAGDMRENGIRVLNMSEEKRKKDKE